MVAACEMSVVAGKLDRASADRVVALLERLGLPTQAPLAGYRDELLELIHADKKVAAGRVRLVLAEAIGRVNGHFAEALLGGSMPWEVDLRAHVLGDDLGDFTLSTSEDAQPGASRGAVNETFYIKVFGKDNTALRGVSADTNLRRPGM